MAVRAPAPVFAAVGVGAWGPVQELRAHPELRLVASPRQAALLLVAGAVSGEHQAALAQVHDQIPHPRRTVGWNTDLQALGLPDAVVTRGGRAQVAAAVTDAWRRCRAEPGLSEGDLLPDVEPNPWRGVGPYGQGGEGMMGGVPYGRPMAMTGADRDGVSLDRLEVTIGPFLPMLPSGVTLDLVLQGDVIQSAVAYPAPAPPSLLEPAEPVSRHRSHLRWLAHALHVHGLDGLAARAAALAPIDVGTPGVADGVVRLRNQVRRSGLLWSLRGQGPLDGRGDCRRRWMDRLDQLVDGSPAEPAPGDEVVGLLCGFTWHEAVATLVSVGWAGRLPDPVAAR